MSLLSKDYILRFLPHKDPFLFIDSVESIEFEGKGFWFLGDKVVDKKQLIGVAVETKFEIKESMDVLRGHFPGNPIVPGVIQIEMMAQTSCFTLIPALIEPLNVNLEVALIKVESAKFRKPLRPGMNVHIKSVCQKVRDKMMSYNAWIYCENEIYAEASIFAMANF